MYKSLIALAIGAVGAIGVPAAAQPAQPAQPTQSAPAISQAQPPQTQMVKKLVCEDNDDPFTNIHRVCHTVMVPAKPTPSNNTAQRAPTPPHSGN